ncbi:MAG: methyltransferase family protein [Candidatus Limnocylindrales bacterium]
MRIPDLGRNGQGWVVLQIVLIVAIAAAGVPEPSWNGTAGGVSAAIGATLIVVGGLLVFMGSRALGTSFSPNPRPVEIGHLVQSGIYAGVRHPIYGGIMMCAFGWGLFVASPVALLLAVVLVVVLVLKSTLEEAWLVQRYPGYTEYRQHTNRYLPPIFRARKGA